MPDSKSEVKINIDDQKLKWSKYVVIVFLCLVVLAISWHVHFRQVPLAQGLSKIEAGVLYDGQLGRTLRQSGYVELSRDDYSFGGRDFCANQDDYLAPQGEYFYTVLITVFSNVKQLMYVNLGSMDAVEKNKVRFVLRPGLRTYRVGLTGPKERVSRMRLWLTENHEAVITEVWLDGFFFPRIPVYIRENNFIHHQDILEMGTGEVGVWDNEPESIKLDGANPYVDLPISEEHIVPRWQNSFFQRSRKNSVCQFQVAPYERQEFDWLAHENNAPSIKSIHIDIAEDDLKGDKGLLAMRDTHRGKVTEKKVKVTIHDGIKTKEYRAGMRFHGGSVGRTRDLESYRLYFRNRQARPEDFFGVGQGGVPRLVLKYTKIARIESISDTNPFAHAFALDVARSMGVLVPRSRLVNLHINGEHKGLYLAMDHLTENSLDEWLDGEDFRAFVYKRPNSIHAVYAQGFVYGHLLRAKGEEVLRLAREIFDLDNLLNSMVMSAYIGDDDFCQGVDLIQNPEIEKYVFTIVNWDLDHGFIFISDTQVGQGEPWQLSSTLPLRTGFELCSRLMFMRHIYHESSEFRMLYRRRVENMFKGPLAEEKLHRLLERYRRVNRDLKGKYDEGIHSLERYIDNREAFMLNELTEFEHQTEQRIAEKK